MTSIFDQTGKNVACTVLQVGPCYVTQVRTSEVDGYEAIQLGFGEAKEKHLAKPQIGQFAKAGLKPMRELKEFKEFDASYKVGDMLNVSLFKEGDLVEVTGTTKGKGFQGVVWWGRPSHPRPAQPTARSGFNWCVFNPFARIQGYAHGWPYGQRPAHDFQLEGGKDLS
jgi:ribosomal protein L3